MAFTLNGTAIDDPNSFFPSRQRIESAERTADGGLVVDVITVKQRYEITYNVLTGTEISPFISLYDAGTFVVFTYPEGGSTQTKTVRIADISHSLINYDAATGTEYWHNVRIILVER